MNNTYSAASVVRFLTTGRYALFPGDYDLFTHLVSVSKEGDGIYIRGVGRPTADQLRFECSQQVGTIQSFLRRMGYNVIKISVHVKEIFDERTGNMACVVCELKMKFRMSAGSAPPANYKPKHTRIVVNDVDILEIVRAEINGSASVNATIGIETPEAPKALVGSAIKPGTAIPAVSKSGSSSMKKKKKDKPARRSESGHNKKRRAHLEEMQREVLQELARHSSNKKVAHPEPRNLNAEFRDAAGPEPNKPAKHGGKFKSAEIVESESNDDDDDDDEE